MNSISYFILNENISYDYFLLQKDFWRYVRRSSFRSSSSKRVHELTLKIMLQQLLNETDQMSFDNERNAELLLIHMSLIIEIVLIV